MLSLNYIMIAGIIIMFAMLMRRYYEVEERRNRQASAGELHMYLLNDATLGKNVKPMLWIYIPYEINARNWGDFQSRTNKGLNQPYLYLTMKTIITHCDYAFNICIFDDSAFHKIIPNWEINVKLLADPLLKHVRQLAFAKMLHLYGGMIVPISFLCLHDLSDIYERGIHRNRMFLCEHANTNVTSSAYRFYPDMYFMGSVKGNKTMLQLIEFMERTMSVDNTAQIDFLGDFNRWCNSRIYKEKTINLIDGKDIGIKTASGENILVEHLLGDSPIPFAGGMAGIYIPADVILKRNKYEWFARLSVSQVLELQNVEVIKYFNSFYFNTETQSQSQPPNKWIDFWSVPSQISIWGHQPNNLGDNVPRRRPQ
jgi:hypothetical protein